MYFLKLKNYLKIFLGQKKTALIFILVILLKIILSSSTMMTDLTHNYYKAKDIEPNIDNISKGYTLSTFIHHSVFKFYSLFLPEEKWFGNVKNNDHDFMEYTYSIQESFLKQKYDYLRIFFLKLPFFLSDILILFILPLFFENTKKRREIFFFWLLNPVVFLVANMFGTVEPIAILFMVLSLLFLKKNKYLLSLILILLSAWTKFEAIFIIPFILIYILKRSNKTKFYLLFLLTTVFFFFQIKTEIVGRFFRENLFFKWPYNYFFFANITITEDYLSYIFIVLYSYIITTYFQDNVNSFQELIKFCLLALFSVFAVNFFHPQWFLITIPFISLFRIYKDKKNNIYPLLIFSYFSLLLVFDKHLTINLFITLNPEYILNMPSLYLYISKFFPVQEFLNILRSIFQGIIIAYMVSIFKKNKKS